MLRTFNLHVDLFDLDTDGFRSSYQRYQLLMHGASEYLDLNWFGQVPSEKLHEGVV